MQTIKCDSATFAQNIEKKIQQKLGGLIPDHTLFTVLVDIIWKWDLLLLSSTYSPLVVVKMVTTEWSFNSRLFL